MRQQEILEKSQRAQFVKTELQQSLEVRFHAHKSRFVSHLHVLYLFPVQLSLSRLQEESKAAAASLRTIVQVRISLF